MKKNYSDWGEFCHSLKKTLLIMRIAIVLLLVGFLQTHANDAYAQKTRLSVSFTNAQLAKVLDQIENESEFFFLYNEKLIDANRKVSIDAKDERIDEVLKTLFAGTDVEYTITDRKIILAPAFLAESQQQGKKVTGKVTDQSGVSLPGVSVVLKGTTTGVITDSNGNYSLSGIPENATLQFSFVGMKTQELAVGDKTTINVILADETIGIEEVVAIGYGQTTKKDATGAVVGISAKDFDQMAAESPAQLFRGKVSGVQVTSASGEPGGGVSVRIRGSASLRSGNEPLVVLDGVVLDGSGVTPGGANAFGQSAPKNPLNFINQNDIESISILKDASSTAIYGSRGANGVIIITTKKGTSPEPTISLKTSVGISVLSRDIGLLTPEEYAKAVPSKDFGGRDYDWKDAILQKGIRSSNDVSVMQSTTRSNYRISLGASKQDGIVKQTGLDKYTAALNNSTKYFDGRFTLDTKFIVSALKDRTEAFAGSANWRGDLLSSAFRWNPTRPIKDKEEKYTFVDDQSNLNPVELLNAYEDYTNTIRLVGNLASTVKILDNLDYKFSFGIDKSVSERASQLDPSFRFAETTITNPDNKKSETGSANIVKNNSLSKIFEHTLTYKKSFSENLNMDAVLGYSYYDYIFDGNSISAKGFGDGQTKLIDNIEGAASNQFRAASYKNGYEVQSFFGRINGNYKRFLFTATLRADGSTRFGGNNKYGYFPSVGMGYKIFEDKEGTINNLKARINWGITGNQDFANNYAALGVQEYTSGGVNSLSNRNENLKWEEKTSYGVGFDFGLLNERLTGTIDYYFSSTENLLFTTTLEATQPSPAVRRFINLPGKVENSGLDLGLQYAVIQKKDLNWDVSTNISFLTNKLKAGIFEPVGYINGQGLTGAFSQVLANGRPIYNYYLLDFQGFDEKGNNLFTGADGKPVSDGSAVPHLIGDASPLPKITFGFNTNLSYKNWDLGISCYGQFGNYIYNNTANALFFKGALRGGTNITKDVAESNEAPGNANSASTRFLEKGDFLRLSNLSLGYNFKKELLEWAYIKSARLYVSGTNLFVITGYSGFDPEVNSSTRFEGVSQFGLDYLSFPKAATFNIGLNVTF